MLRTLLQEITNQPNIGLHLGQIESARTGTRHTIRVLTRSHDDLRYNCVMYALGIHRESRYVAMLKSCHSDIHASTDFLQFLVDKGYLTESASEKPGFLIAYLDENRFRHIGIVTGDGRICSKWGIGHLYEHAVWETPNSYGTTVRYFEPMKLENVLNAFFEFSQRPRSIAESLAMSGGADIDFDPQRLDFMAKTVDLSG